MSDLRDLLANSNSYMMDKVRINTDNINPNLIMKIAKYIMKMLRIFGVASEDISIGINAGSKAASGGNIEDAIMPFLKVLSDYRDEVRSLSQKKAGKERGRKERERVGRFFC